MKLAISNLCTKNDNLLNELPVDAIETVFNRIDTNYNKPVIAAQALLYEWPTLTIFHPEFIPKMGSIISKAADRGVNKLIFGAPNARNEGSKNKWLAIACLDHIGKLAAQRGVSILLEPIPLVYGSAYLTTLQQTMDVLEYLNNPGLGLNFDIANILTVDNGINYGRIERVNASKFMKHVHISAPNLEPICNNSTINYDYILKSIADSGYDGHVSIEMRAQDDESVVRSVDKIKIIMENL